MGWLSQRLYSVWLTSTCLAVVATLSSASACETPVYRYAMYRWQPAPYEVYFFHDQPAGESDQQVQDLLIEAERGDAARANIALIPVNVSEDPELASVPPDVKKAWTERNNKQMPSYFISTPYGVGLSFEQLDEAKVKSLIDSPARKSLAAQLETGKLGVFVMLSGKDDAENKSTESILNGLVEEVQEGKVSLYVSPTDEPVSDDSATKPNFDIGLIQLDRESKEEQWFVSSLLAMEPDLVEEERPMVFLVYGRARALLPYIGKGITRENLIREIEFISGACSCTVKEQNPGVDLLVKYDWESAAAMLAEKFGSEEGNESQFGPEMFFPELLIPEKDIPATTEVVAEVEEPITDNAIVELPESSQTADASVALSEPEDVNESDSSVELTTGEVAVDPEFALEASSTEVASLPPRSDLGSSNTTESDTTSYASSVWIVGAGVGVALLILFGLTFVVLRPQ